MRSIINAKMVCLPNSLGADNKSTLDRGLVSMDNTLSDKIG
ncbi:hypothetical protein [Aquicella siphonis]|nr:hypothetical protein [Aquicella siphonis]